MHSININRKYLIAAYQTVDIGEEINNLPDKIITNPALIEKLYELMFLNAEIAYKKYLNQVEKLNNYSPEELLPMLNEMKANTLDEIKFLFEEKEN